MASVNAAKTNGAGGSKAGKRQGWGIAAILAIVACGGTVLSGCAGLANTANAKLTPQEAVQISPSDMTFPSVPVGQKATQTATLTNTGDEPVTITQLASSAIEFATFGTCDAHVDQAGPVGKIYRGIHRLDIGIGIGNVDGDDLARWIFIARETQGKCCWGQRNFH